MVLDWLGLAFVILTMLGCVVLAAVNIGLLYLLWLHLSLRREALAHEARHLAAPLPPDAALPHVVVQLPVFNEGAIVERAIASAGRLDWPSGKLHVQICDDSSDGTTEIACAAAQRVRAEGIDVAVISRGSRSEFKAGALRDAMAQTEHAYFAIFDVDFVPAPDFLRRCMAFLLADPALAFVQARPDFLNANENALTRAQTILLDYHYGFEQATRSWAKHLLPFNGSCGIWRRAAIEAAGGWRGDTLLEDWDLSHRAWLKGWRGTFVTSVTTPGELPAEPGVWMRQQTRWAAGGGQVALKVLPAFRGRGLSLWDYLHALSPLMTWFAYAAFPTTLIVAVVAMLLRPSWALGLTVYALFAAMAVVLFGLMWVAGQTVRRGTPLLSFVLDFPVVLLLSLYVSWANLRSLPATLRGRPCIFVRTPKRGTIPKLP
jgi:cellulose synthase/poly-beta-1,6-N-acetylglucosamine synthase-like glycosyltransferase